MYLINIVQNDLAVSGQRFVDNKNSITFKKEYFKYKFEKIFWNIVIEILQIHSKYLFYY